MKKFTVLALTIGLMLSSNVFSAGMLTGAGATFPYPVYSAWANWCG